MRTTLLALTSLAWLFFAIARFVPPASLTRALEPIGTAAAITGLLGGPALIVAAVLAVLSARGGSRIHRALALLAVAGALAVLAPRPTQSTPGESTLTVMSWNVARLGGIHARDGKAAADEAKTQTTACLASRLAIHDPDVLVLTEVSRYDVESILEPALGRMDRRCVHAAHDAGKQLSSGTLVCAWSRALAIGDHDIVSVTQHGLPDQQFPIVRMSSRTQQLQIAGLHLPPIHRSPDRWPSWIRAGLASRAQQDLIAAVEQARDRSWPTVLAGDFNQSRHTWLHASLRETYADAHEDSRIIPGGTRLLAGWPVARIDYVYAERSSLSVVDARVDRAGCSDHDPVIARLRAR